MSSAQGQQGRRPLRLVALSGFIAALGLLDLARMLQALMQSDFLIALRLSISPFLLAWVNGVWALVLLGCALGLWWRRPWARRATAIAVPLHALTFLGLQLAFARSDFARQALPAALLEAGVTILAVWVLLSLPGTKRAFATTDKP